MMWNRKDAKMYLREVLEAIEWNHLEVDKKNFDYSAYSYYIKAHLLTEQPNMYWLCQVTTVTAADEVIEVNADLTLKVDRKINDKVSYTIYIDKDGGVDRIVQR